MIIMLAREKDITIGAENTRTCIAVNQTWVYCLRANLFIYKRYETSMKYLVLGFKVWFCACIRRVNEGNTGGMYAYNDMQMGVSQRGANDFIITWSISLVET